MLKVESTGRLFSWSFVLKKFISKGAKTLKQAKKITGILCLLTLFYSCSYDFVDDVIKDREVENRVPVIPSTNPKKAWTIMHYSDADCSLEIDIINDVRQMKFGFAPNEDLNLIVLIDRHPDHHNDEITFGENFSDTRLYKITSDKATRINGGKEFPEITTKSLYEANMGDANTLRKFINMCKTEYPAEHYALIISNHGGGPRKKSSSALKSENPLTKEISLDETNGGDVLYLGEISDVLSDEQSVDLLGFDACLMGSLEIAYQFRPNYLREGGGGFSADYLVASAPLEVGAGWDYANILARITVGETPRYEVSEVTGGDLEKKYSPLDLTPKDLGAVIVEEQHDSTVEEYDQSLSLYDLSRVFDVKTAVDDLAVAIDQSNTKIAFENIRGRDREPVSLYYFAIPKDPTNADFYSIWEETPFFDVYDLAERVFYNESNFPASVISRAEILMKAVDDLVVHSFAGDLFSYRTFQSNFKQGKNGIHIFFPDGSKVNAKNEPMWINQWWYTSRNLYKERGDPHYYGNIDFCNYNNNGQVDSWVEMLDKWYDPTGDYNIPY